MRLCIEGKAAKRSGCRGWGGAWGRLSHVCCLGGRGRRLIAALAKREDKVSTYDRNRAVQWQRKKRMREGTACDGGAVRHSSHQGGGRARLYRKRTSGCKPCWWRTTKQPAGRRGVHPFREQCRSKPGAQSSAKGCCRRASYLIKAGVLGSSELGKTLYMPDERVEPRGISR